MTLFVLHYALAVTLALNPEGIQSFSLAGFALSGGSVGYFARWAFMLRRNLSALPLAGRSV